MIMCVEYLKEKEENLGETLTVKDLIDILKKYPDGMKVMITWESTLNELKEEFIYESITGNLLLDGDYGFYKKDFAKFEHAGIAQW